MPVKSVLEAIHDTLWNAMEADERVLVMGEDVGAKGGVFRVTAGFLEHFGEERVIDTPLAELGIVGVAIGMALNGLLPVAEIQFADFIHPAFDQIVNEAARIRYRSNGNWECPMVIRAPYGGGIHGALYHSQSVEGFFTHVPGLKVVAPSTPYDAAGLLWSSIQDRDPVLFLEHKKTYRLIKGEVPDGLFSIPIGKGQIVREGEDITVISYGMMLHHTLEAAERVAKDGISVEVVDPRTLRPLDEDLILSSVKKTSKVLIVHEDNGFMGFGAEIAALIADQAFEWLDGPIKRLCGPEVPAMPYNDPQEHWFLPNPDKIEAAIRDLAAY
ncbi:MAG: alpha-ketoacid dehydrogenase subunit beta [Ardenticatenia bacterium]|uniref:2-oxoisovalerate dehydrogenase n=1 Tax=Ardenticatena maritima TaxID=872965 RepID=A0A0M8K5I2_9CHLR|nr:alpha-ketoacid dehydrogenase subunit beta [Ardenticatena maritima]KPL89451.1 2-oxoisovalerate dehydrogenase [Ardenticatena maritima]RME11148.1 MAG: alpha-ketoacid dehydrogenase subunit beta [Ardenticatenia bacterium]GAP62105.1 2-oxoisovalerate dehydrogenase E1 component beta subunit [Ardenticatena maritima]